MKSSLCYNVAAKFYVNWSAEMNRWILFLFSILFSTLYPNEEYKFAGKHFIASYMDCDPEAMANLDLLVQAMDQAVVASGATILNKTAHVFPGNNSIPNAITIVYLLSESHASLHTYPEHSACFVDLFTCGESCSSERFDACFRAYLKPQNVNACLFARHKDVEAVPLAQ